ncbi:hypothetical protein [Desulfosarcina ovata]|uniref:Bacterial OB-fold domain-containing protein n=1 Tax=Desulfosarcina ovata subsp. ovata TaxID=2752305 RepID=A0A5K8AH84_9BACT|nr:hypothetical protein [Desulfosarcina ovata]BBO91859.1 hypothetical protein DSCOOX_50390 [Desulfosarcina ovata subsp. ovata]
MTRAAKKMVMVWVAMAMILGVPFAAMAAESVTITGEVNDSYQIVDASGQVYEIADTTPGNDLVENHIGEKAKVTGTLEQDQDLKIITVTAFQIITE